MCQRISHDCRRRSKVQLEAGAKVAVVGKAQFDREPAQVGFALSKAFQRERKPEAQ